MSDIEQVDKIVARDVRRQAYEAEASTDEKPSLAQRGGASASASSNSVFETPSSTRRVAELRDQQQTGGNRCDAVKSKMQKEEDYHR